MVYYSNNDISSVDEAFVNNDNIQDSLQVEIDDKVDYVENTEKPETKIDSPQPEQIDQPNTIDLSAVDAYESDNTFATAKSLYGCLDVIGNVAEWCRSAEGYYARGGSWLSMLKHVRTFSNQKQNPETRSNRIGFRVVCEEK